MHYLLLSSASLLTVSACQSIRNGAVNQLASVEVCEDYTAKSIHVQHYKRACTRPPVLVSLFTDSVGQPLSRSFVWFEKSKGPTLTKDSLYARTPLRPGSDKYVLVAKTYLITGTSFDLPQPTHAIRRYYQSEPIEVQLVAGDSVVVEFRFQRSASTIIDPPYDYHPACAGVEIVYLDSVGLSAPALSAKPVVRKPRTLKVGQRVIRKAVVSPSR